MKNERIITHFQSYTTAKDCVKDLTPHFRGRISIASLKSDLKPTETPETTEMGAGEIIEDLSEIGGIALGTIADLIPGLGPVLSGGPVVGAVVGDVFGDYMVARQHLTPERDAAGVEAPTSGAVYVAVDVVDAAEAELAERIIREHNEMPYRSQTSMAVASTGMTADPKHSVSGVDRNPSLATTIPEGPAEPLCEDIPEVAPDPDADEEEEDIPDGLPQPSGRVKRRIPHRDGYDLDPLPPFSPQGWIDPNIGLGDTELVDPTIFAHDDIDKVQ